jgi:hypothetical protein
MWANWCCPPLYHPRDLIHQIGVFLWGLSWGSCIVLFLGGWEKSLMESEVAGSQLTLPCIFQFCFCVTTLIAQYIQGRQSIYACIIEWGTRFHLFYLMERYGMLVCHSVTLWFNIFKLTLVAPPRGEYCAVILCSYASFISQQEWLHYYATLCDMTNDCPQFLQ